MKQVFNISSGNETMQEAQAERVLSVRIGERHFGFAITGADAENLVELAWYTDEEMDEKQLDELFGQSPILGQEFSRINICYDHTRSVLIPLIHYQDSTSRQLLQTMHGVVGNEELLTDQLSEWQLNNVYGVPVYIKDWAGRHFPNAVITHAYSVGIRNIELTNFEGSLLVDFRSEDFMVIASRSNKILLAQTFTYSRPADVIYYLLKTAQEFSFSQDSVRITLSGLIDKESVLYREIYQYFIQVKFREPAWSVQSEESPVYPSHFFTSLNDLARCAS